MVTDRGSPNAVAASSNRTPCLRSLVPAFVSSHSNLSANSRPSSPQPGREDAMSRFGTQAPAIVSNVAPAAGVEHGAVHGGVQLDYAVRELGLQRRRGVAAHQGDAALRGDDECRRDLERLEGHPVPRRPAPDVGAAHGAAVREGLDRHDRPRPPHGRRAAPAKGAEQTSAAKTQAASTRGAASAAKQEAGADSAATSAAKVSAQAPAQPGDQAADRPDTSAAKPLTYILGMPHPTRPHPPASRLTCVPSL